MDIQKQLVAVEASEEAPQIMSAARRIAQASSSTPQCSVFCSVLPLQEFYPDVNYAPLSAYSADIMEQLKTSSCKHLKPYLQDHEKLVVREGYPVHQIVEQAHEMDLIVMGKHSRHGVKRLLGSTTLSVLNHCDSNLLAVQVGESSNPGEYQRVLMAVDTTDSSGPVVEQGSSLQCQDHYVVSVVPPINSVYANIYGDFDFGDNLHSIAQDLRSQIHLQTQTLAAKHGINKDHVLICEGDAADKIIDTAQELNADLIVLAANNRSALNRLLLGSTSRKVLNQAQCDVLVLRVD